MGTAPHDLSRREIPIHYLRKKRGGENSNSLAISSEQGPASCKHREPEDQDYRVHQTARGTNRRCVLALGLYQDADKSLGGDGGGETGQSNDCADHIPPTAAKPAANFPLANA